MADSKLQRRATHHAFAQIAKYIDVDGGIFKNILYWVNCTNFTTLTIKTGNRNKCNISFFSTIWKCIVKSFRIGHIYIYTSFS
jgi:hypothetical protein